ncbi:MAG: dihydrofolate synthase / folylpolyglutamate synthase [Frankiaceae bacterium]|nr:dihydrofolate synthase / folylpolyglutamate synthase [Frankiaceae bacterium]
MSPDRAGADAASPTARLERALAGRYPSEDHMQPDLERIRDLLDLLGSPQKSYQSIHITGTNGKTSTARMADSLLRAFGVRVGRYTSPHLQSVTERICIDGAPVSPELMAAAYDELAPYVELVDSRHPQPMTFFEVLTGLAFAVFADAPVDAAVVEVGLGGAWDATNTIAAPVAVVMPISLDHQKFLGDTIADIATEKSGIVHPGAKLVLAAQPLEAAEVLLRRAVEVGAEVAREGVEFGVVSREIAVGGQRLSLQGLAGRYDDILLPLHGGHQAHNAAAALAAVEAFFGAGPDRQLDIETVRAGFAAAESPGRLEVVRRGPTVLLDAAHNPAGAAALALALAESFTFDRLIGVLAVLNDKDARGIVDALADTLDLLVVTASTSPRALPARELASIATEVFGPDRVAIAESLPDAIETAVQLADTGELGGGGVVITGSVVTVGEARTLLRAR